MSELIVSKAITKKEEKKDNRLGVRRMIFTTVIVVAALSLVTAIYFANVSHSSEHLFSKTYVTCKERILGFERMGAYDTLEKFKDALSYC